MVTARHAPKVLCNPSLKRSANVRLHKHHPRLSAGQVIADSSDSATVEPLNGTQRKTLESVRTDPVKRS